MSQENVELVRSAYEAFNLDGMVADFAHQYLQRAIRLARFLGG